MNLFFTITNCRINYFPLSLADESHEFQIHVSVRILTIKINQWARANFCSYRKKIVHRDGSCWRVQWRWQFHFSCKTFRRVLGQVPLFTFRQCEDYSEQSKTRTSSLWRFLGKDVYFNVSILTLFVCSFIEYSYILWLRFHRFSFKCNKLNSKKRIFLLTIFETRLIVFVPWTVA